MSEYKSTSSEHGQSQPGVSANVSAADQAKILRRSKRIGIIMLALLGMGVVVTVFSRTEHHRQLEETTNEQAKQYVSTIQAKQGQDSERLVLPGTLKGFVESPIYARTNGYVLRWTHDIGSRVEKGQVLAEIDTPEVDQQLSEAIATRGQVASNLNLTQLSVERWEGLRKKDAVTQQELDEKRSAYVQAQATLKATEANIRRLQQLKSFKQVVAPFSGVVTARNIDVGDLINAGNGGEGKALFSLAQIDSLRIYVYVPQAYAQQIKLEAKISVTQAELPGQTFAGTVIHTAGAINANTGSLQVEVRLSNHDGKLLPGAYVQVTFPTPPSHALVVPINTLLFRSEGPCIAVVDSTEHVKLQSVQIGRDFGKTVEILSGISANDRLIVNPADSLANGDAVTVIQQPNAKAKS